MSSAEIEFQLGIKHIISSPYKLQANERIEPSHKFLKTKNLYL